MVLVKKACDGVLIVWKYFNHTFILIFLVLLLPKSIRSRSPNHILLLGSIYSHTSQ